MKYDSKLTKRYYFPIVQGSNHGYVVTESATYNAFVTYIKTKLGVTKVTNYSQVWHWFARAAVQIRAGYYVGWWKEGERMLKDLDKANKYLNRQYNRIQRHLENNRLDKAIAVWKILHTRSKLWWMVLIVRKLPFLEIPVLRVKSMLRSIMALARKDSANLKFKRVFLPEYKSNGQLKKLRPLGVPSAEWRVLAASHEFLLVNVWAKDWATNQFACMPKRGVADAWIRILTLLTRREGDQLVYNSIIGYDLAKFFDSVYISNIHAIMYGFPEKLRDWYVRLCKVKPMVRPQDRAHERARQEALLKQRPIKELKGVSGYQLPDGKTVQQLHNKPDIGFPQGLNTSPIMACRVLDRIGVLGYGEIVQYVDDGLIFNRTDGKSKLTIETFGKMLMTVFTGLALAPEKTEVIMEDGKFLKPLKFLGCSYDGKTFVAATRKGVYKVEGAEGRIEEIILWLSKNGNLLGAYRKKLTSLINEGWNPPETKWWSVPVTGRTGPTLSVWGSTWWTQTKVKVERLAVNSVEAMSIETLGPKLGPITSSSNTATMVGSYYLLRYSNPKGRRGSNVMKLPAENKLMACW